MYMEWAAFVRHAISGQYSLVGVASAAQQYLYHRLLEPRDCCARPCTCAMLADEATTER